MVYSDFISVFLRSVHQWPWYHQAGINGQAEGREVGERAEWQLSTVLGRNGVHLWGRSQQVGLPHFFLLTWQCVYTNIISSYSSCNAQDSILLMLDVYSCTWHVCICIAVGMSLITTGHTETFGCSLLVLELMKWCCLLSVNFQELYHGHEINTSSTSINFKNPCSCLWE